ncbi:MAG TPA: hypothetical protein VFL57_03340 [Bryobacteraceae bacterium]|nr:hypothetical protein [Bryobacteraceae bacterium]
MRLAVALSVASILAAADYPKVTFTREFKGSAPPYYMIEISRSGAGLYKEAPDDQQPISFRLSEAVTAGLFGRLENAGNAQKPLESNLKVANMGLKTIRFDDGRRRQQVSFNYSLDENAQALADMFEKINETQQHFINLERSVRFDRLGVNKIILQIETSHDRQRILGADALLPVLDRVAKSEAFMHMTRERAAKLAEAIRHPAQKPETAANNAAAQEK